MPGAGVPRGVDFPAVDVEVMHLPVTQVRAARVVPRTEHRRGGHRHIGLPPSTDTGGRQIRAAGGRGGVRGQRDAVDDGAGFGRASGVATRGGGEPAGGVTAVVRDLMAVMLGATEAR